MPGPPEKIPSVFGLPPVSYKKLYAFATPCDKLGVVLACISATANGCVFPLFSLVFGKSLNTFNDPSVSTSAMVTQINTFAFYFFLIAIGSSLLTWLDVFLIGMSTEGQIRRMRTEYCRNLLRLDFTWHDTHRAGEAVTRLSDAITSVQTGLKKVTGVVKNVATLVCGFAIGFSVSWKLTLVIAACAPMFALCLAALIIVSIKGQKAVRFAYARAGDVANECVSLQRAVSAYGGEVHELRRFTSFVALAERFGIWQGRGLGFAVGCMLTTFMAMYGISCYAGARFVIIHRTEHPECRYNPTLDGCFSGGDIITTFVAVLLGAVSMGQVGPLMGDISAARAAAADLFGVIDTVPSIDVYDDSTELYRGPEPCKDTTTSAATAPGLGIEFRSCTFAYPSRPETNVLSDFSLTIAPGESIGVVGQSGSGKSTLVLLVMRAYDPQQGVVLVHGVDVRKWHLPSLRRMLGLVQQEPVLFGCSIHENIAMGVPEMPADAVDKAEVEAAAKKANAHDFIMQLPQAYDTMAGASVSSSQLSGGQRQRVCIARALIRAPRIMLLDEATSALDTTSERTVQAALDSAGAQSAATTLIIAHRLSTLANVHRIVVVEKGVIVEEGTPAQLSAKEGGLFKAMKQAQEITDPSKGTESANKGSVDDAAQRLPTASIALQKPGSVTAEGTAKASKLSTSDMCKRLLRMQLDDWKIGIFACFIAPASGCIQPCVALVYGGVIPVFFNPDDAYVEKESLKYLGFFFLLAAGYFVGVIGRISTFTYLGERLTRKLREASFRSILRQPGAFFDESSNSVGRLTSRLATDATLVKGISGDALGSVLEGCGSLVAAICIAFSSTWQLALVLMTVFPFLIIGAVFEFKGLGAFTEQNNTEMAEASQLVSECVTATRAVAAYGLQARTMVVYEKALVGPYQAGTKATLVTAAGSSFQRLVLMNAYSLCFFVGAKFIEQGALEFTGLIKAFLAVTLAAESIGRITSMAPDTVAATIAAANIFALIDAGDASTIDPLATSGFKGTEGADGGLSIEFRNVSFVYPSRPDVPVLQNFNLTIEPGEFVGIVGQSGSGKSTLVLLVTRMYDPQVGDVFVDGVNVKDWNVSALRGAFGLVQQEPALFADSIGYNIGYGVASDEKPAFGQGVQPKETSDVGKGKGKGKGRGKGRGGCCFKKSKQVEEDAAGMEAPKEASAEYVLNISNIDEEGDEAAKPKNTPPGAEKYALPSAEVVDAAGQANASQFISRLPDGFATYCGSRGSLLSGGQKQRVAIARALLRKPRGLLLDEATAALDSQSEKKVQAALDHVIAQSKLQPSGTAPRTTLVIAHRLSTLAKADRIVVLERGALVEQGSHDQLMLLADGKYKALAQAQGSTTH